MWLWMALISGVFQGFSDVFKKKALEDIPILNVLALYSLFSFLLVFFEIENALTIDPIFLLVIFIKSLIIFFSWILGFAAIRALPISIYTPLATLNPLFVVLFGVLLLKEQLNSLQIAGVVTVLAGYYLIGKKGEIELNGSLWKNKYFYLVVANAFLSAISAFIDKIALKTINTGQMQFWFCLFLTLLYSLAFYINRKRINDTRKPVKFHFSILLMSLFLVASDRLYFEAVNVNISQLSIIMPLKRSSVLVSTLGGGVFFKEKNIKAKLACVCMVLVGITILFVAK